MSEVKTISIDVINRTIPILNDERIPVINKPNPCYGYTATAKEVWYLIQLPNYYVYEAGTKNIINGHNYYKYFPNESGGGGGEITIDPEVNNTSTNAIQNKAVYKFVNDEVDPLRTKTGMDVAGKTFVIDDVSIEAQAGAEIFNNYEDNKATGIMSHAEGDKTIASGPNSHAEGNGTRATNSCAHAEGSWTTASGSCAHTEGGGTNASGNTSHAEGGGTTASGSSSHSEGGGTRATGDNSHAEGGGTHASGNSAHAEGGGTTASGPNSHAEGSGATSTGSRSHAEGNNTTAFGMDSHAEGASTNKQASVIEISSTTTNDEIITSWNTKKFSCAKGPASHTEGKDCLALGDNAHAEGVYTNASGEGAHSEGVSIKGLSGDINITTASGKGSHAEGASTTASGDYSHAEGKESSSTGVGSHAEGNSTVASGNFSHSEGGVTKATGIMSHAEGDGTIASGDCSHAEGTSTTAGYCAHSEGIGTGATGAHSHAEGNGTKASANGAHSEGRGTIAASKYQHAQGEYNRKDAENKYAFIIGNGTSDTSRSNAFAVDWKGRIYVNNSDTGVDVLTLNQNIQIADRIYTGTDLTAKFADEISKYSDSWAWIKSRITDGDYDGIHVGDYIPITCSNGYLLTAQIAGINTYTGYGSPAVGNHIDFICKELWEDAHTFNQVNYNNGNANNSNPFLASDLNCWLNSTTGSVPNSESDASITTAVDYTTSGVLSFLPDSLKSQIVPKTIALPGRYTEGSILKDDNSQEWQSTGKLWIPSEAEVYGTSCWGNSGYGTCGFVQYPIFANNMNRAKIKCTSKEQGNYWLLSARADQSTYVTNVNASGICDSSYATATNVTVPICFRI